MRESLAFKAQLTVTDKWGGQPYNGLTGIVTLGVYLVIYNGFGALFQVLCRLPVIAVEQECHYE